MESYSDEKFFGLFGDEPYRESSPTEPPDEVKLGYIGKKPSEITTFAAYDFLMSSNDALSETSIIPAIDYFTVLPAIIRAYYCEPVADISGITLSGFFSFNDDFEPNGLDPISTKTLLIQLGYGPDHLAMMTGMLRDLKKRLLYEADPYYVPPKFDREVGKAIQIGIDGLTRILAAM